MRSSPRVVHSSMTWRVVSKLDRSIVGAMPSSSTAAHLFCSTLVGAGFGAFVSMLIMAVPFFVGITYGATYIITFVYVVAGGMTGGVLGVISGVGAAIGSSLAHRAPRRVRIGAVTGASLTTSLFGSVAVVVPAVHLAFGGRSDLMNPIYIPVALACASAASCYSRHIQQQLELRNRSSRD